MNYLKKLSYLLLLLLVVGACKKDKDVEEDPDTTEISGETKRVNRWIYNILDELYLWTDDLNRTLVPEQQPDPETYFYDDMLVSIDKWSYLTDDYSELEGNLQGIYKSYGFSYALYLKESGSSDVIAVVEYVLPGYPAAVSGIVRGDIFYKINGVEMNTTNYSSLLSADQFVLNFLVETNDGSFTDAGTEITMDAVEVEEDPILMSKVIDENGTKVGYVMYNQFVYSDEDSANLVTTFSSLKAQNIEELVLDLRYNGGGSTYIANMIASMIAPSANVSNSDIFFTYQWNDLYTAYFTENQGANSPNLVSRFDADVPVNLNLDKLYVLTLGGTASASELIMNGLAPYLTVIQIGETTYGKYTVSVPVDDGNDGLSHSWGMLPIVAKSVNSAGVSDYYNGFTPEDDNIIYDDYYHQLGDVNESLLSRALEVISGSASLAQKKSAKLSRGESLGSFGRNPLLQKGIMVKQ